MNKLYIMMGTLICFCLLSISVEGQTTLKCGIVGKHEKKTKKIQRYRKKSTDLRKGWPEFEDAKDQFHQDLIKGVNPDKPPILSCDNSDCFGDNLFDCKPKIIKVTQGKLQEIRLGDFWFNDHVSLIKYDWKCTDCKRKKKESLSTASFKINGITQSVKSVSGNCEESDDSDLARVTPYDEPGVFRLWIDVPPGTNHVVITAKNVDDGQVIFEDDLNNVEECDLHSLANLTDQAPGLYEFEIFLNGEIIKTCTVQSQ